MSKKKSIFLQAHDIVEKRSEEKSRQYGSFSEGMKRAAKIASIMIGKELRAQDIFHCMVALKLSRESFNHKEDNILDCISYLGAYNNFVEEDIKNKKHDTKAKSGRVSK